MENKSQSYYSVHEKRTYSRHFLANAIANWNEMNMTKKKKKKWNKWKTTIIAVPEEKIE